jgi:hypothetical protein
VKYLNHDLNTELILMNQYKLNPNELMCIKVVLLAQDGEYEYLQNFAQVCQLRLLLTTLQSKGIILKSYKLPKEGSSFVPEDVQFNQNFLKKYYRSAFEMGEELFYTYPQSCVVNNQIFNLRSVSHKFNSLEDAFAKYAKQIKNNPDVHKEILDNIRWGIENGYNFTTLDRFIVDRAYEALKAFKEGNTININLESTQLL